jgi:tRNA(fMet)-specific endonuclease VapC
MTLYVLDTDTASLHKKGHPVVVARVLARPIDELAITVITVEEQLSGWYRMLRQARQPDKVAFAYQELAETAEFLGKWKILPFPVPAIARHRQLTAMKLNVRKDDLRIAAIVLEKNAVLVTRNRRDFQRVPNLVIEDWSI